MHELIRAAGTPFGPLIGLAPPMRRAMQGLDLEPVAAALLARIRAHPTDANGWLDASIVLQLLVHPDGALWMQRRALELQATYTLPARRPSLVLLVVMGPGRIMWNMPVELLLEDAGVTLELLYLTADDEWPDMVPDHDVMLVAMAESESNRPLLKKLDKLIEHWPRPVLNPPARIAALSRDDASVLLGGLPGVAMPRTHRIAREELACGEAPLIIRPLDSHAGQNLELLYDAGELDDYLLRVHEQDFYVARFVDYRSADGLYRKYRVALIDGQPFLSHLAISSHWMVHYLNAGMEHSADKRREEAERMADFDSGFARRHAQALQAIHRRAGLDWLTLDCAETADGQLLVFEVGTAMAVHAMDDPGLYPYKQPAMRKLFAAFRAMLEAARR